jgi:hypothetical protein
MRTDTTRHRAWLYEVKQAATFTETQVRSALETGADRRVWRRDIEPQ